MSTCKDEHAIHISKVFSDSLRMLPNQVCNLLNDIRARLDGIYNVSGREQCCITRERQ